MNNEDNKIFDHSKYELKEQILVKSYLKSNYKVLELGARLGIISCTINNILTEKTNQVSVEPDKNIYMSTDDGSLGIKGNVIDAIKSIFSCKNIVKDAKIFSCGPPQMMESVKNYAIDNNISCDLALETIMACGIGICQGCTIEKKGLKSNRHSYRNRFALACIDGPIFNAEDIVTCM